jgi:hypothetical protein
VNVGGGPDSVSRVGSWRACRGRRSAKPLFRVPRQKNPVTAR